MKFAKQLEDNLVPEWRIKYLNYKGAKKKLSNVRRAIRNAQAASASTLGYPSPHVAAGIAQRFRSGSVSQSAAASLKQHLSPTRDRSESRSGPRKSATDPLSTTPASNGLTSSPVAKRIVLSIREDGDEDEFDRRKSTIRRGAMVEEESWKAGKQEDGDPEERRHLNPSPGGAILAPPSAGYGAISPGTAPPVHPASSAAISSRPSLPPALDLPGPARPLEDQQSLRRAQTYDASLSSQGNGVPQGERTPRFALGTVDPTDGSPQTVRPGDDYGLRPPASEPPPTVPNGSRPIFRNVFGSLRHRISNAGKRTALPGIENSQIYLEMTEDAQKEFFNYLVAELQKINDFYESKETEAKERLARIEQQISIMTRNRLLEKEREREAEAEESAAPAFDWKHPKGIVTGTVLQMKKRISLDTRNGNGKVDPLHHSTLPDDSLPTIAKLTSSALETAAGPAQPRHRTATASSFDDYTRRAATQHVRYKTAKRKLKAALIEYYHSLELLKSYSLLNREGFRKILKKFDKTANTHIANKYLEEKVHTTGFASSEEVERLLSRTEDIFATHYERGRRKHAVERLRTREHRRPATGAMFRAGWWLGMVVPLLVQALYQAYHRLDDGYGMKHESEVSYLLQIWAGFAFPTLFMLLFCICCRAWVEARINYVFIFEFDTRNKLDWRELLELPSMFAFIQALLMCRKWLLYTLYRLVWAGYYPVEFRDFWSGDILCSMTYTLGNVPLFFCLWSNSWDNPGQCNSSNSRLLGFFTCLPSIWRLLQCFRRYYDTRNAFPHLANAAKYGCGIMYYMTLSLWRMDKGNEEIKAAFILFAAVNATYTSTWDLLMDWSLLNWYAPNRLLRTELAFRRPLAYYLAMLIDPVIRFSWVFYVIFANEVQHSALLSFVVSLAEVMRRFIWCFFRMENEHCANVNKFRAYKDDVPLPYNVPFSSISPSHLHQNGTPSINGRPTRITTVAPRVTGVEARVDEEIAAVSGGLTPLHVGRRPSISTAAVATGAGIGGLAQLPAAEAGTATSARRPSAPSSLPERTPLLRAYTLATTAHAQDFERKRPPTGTALAETGAEMAGSAPGRFRGYLASGGRYDDDDDDDDDDTESEEDGIKIGLGAGYGGDGTGGSGGYSSSLADDVVEGMAGLSLRRTRTGSRGNADGGNVVDAVDAAAMTGYRGTGAVLSPSVSPHPGGVSPGIGPSNRRGYAGRDYERRRRSRARGKDTNRQER
ncbi:hypothetical protein ABW20_dc0107073 [Dactylellina cionopaga]|nr:hypothetical protein ABW20_dc0107073 [Dactylellina cionopaga]